MPGVVFLIVVPTANFERELIYGTSNNAVTETTATHGSPGRGHHANAGMGGGNNNLNINLPENNNAILRLEVELRDKNVPKYRRGVGGGVPGRGRGIGQGRNAAAAIADARAGAGEAAASALNKGTGAAATLAVPLDRRNLVVPLEKVLEELLVKLEIEHVTWTTSKKGYFHHVVFPLQAGDACETTLHCLTELGIGTKLNSSVSVLPCSVSYDAITDAANMRDDYSDDAEEASRWNNFVESIKSKLTVKQVVDGVRAGGSLSFDYLLLIVTADSLAALGLVENNAPNIVAAMLVSPLMGPVMSITFGAIISDRELMGLFWSQACIWLIYPDKRIPHLKNEAMNSTTAYPFIYTDYLPTEFLINGIVSACLTVVNVICIFITAIIVLKIKEVSAPYTASPDLKRFWETDLRTVRKTNRSTMRHRSGTLRGLGAGDKLMSGVNYHGLDEARNAKMDSALERALAQAESDTTFKKVKRMSYSSNAAGELTERLAKIAGLNKRHVEDPLHTNSSSLAGSRMNSIPNSQLNVDLKALDKIVTSLLEQQSGGNSKATANLEAGSRTPPVQRIPSKKLNRWRPLSRSVHSFKRGDSRDYSAGNSTQLQECSDMQAAMGAQHSHSNMPTIMESSAGSPTPNNAQQVTHNPWTASLERTPGAVRNVLHSISQAANVPLAGSGPVPEDQLNLTQNYVG
ncbi:uncharacterized protein LOC117564698 isoform X2 [Drosophila albomicans]|uniref:Uncharacterized protein LOC117564698 isoform X2 n=1 Tax=Drosophila albomicans TaxID=7291 RepID=A0A9C6T1H1_DROAB|nr:uncharacterized protein LOC117564698 isoform X2 [Drosophila albomicans]